MYNQLKKAMYSISQLKIADIASQSVLTITEEVALAEVVKLFAKTRVSSVVVVAEHKPVGIITERDMLRLLCVGYAPEKPARSVMSAPLLTASEKIDFATVQLMLANRKLRHLVLVNAQGELAGVVSETDFRKHIGHDLFHLIDDLQKLMSPTSEMLPPTTSLALALETMASRGLDHILIGENEVAQGILTERDVPRLMAEGVVPEAIAIASVMSSPLTTIPLHTDTMTAVRLMENHRLRHLVVVNAQGQTVGVLGQHSLLEKLSLILLEDGQHYMREKVAVMEGKFKTVVEQLPIPLCHIDDAGKLIYINPQFSYYFGYTLQDLATIQDWWRLTWPELSSQLNLAEDWKKILHQDCSMAESLNQESHSPVIQHISCRDGSQKYIELGVVRFGDGYLLTFSDVTDVHIQSELLQRQLSELQRWQSVMLYREDKVIELKKEVNSLLVRLGESPRYLLGIQKE